MANPQIENGHTDLAHEVIEAFSRIRIPGECMQVLWIVLRKTYGYHKKSDHISLSQFSVTGMKKPNIVRALRKLESMGIIKKDNGCIAEYRFNKDYDEWIPLSKKITVIKNDNAIIKDDNKSLSKKIHTKENSNENITNENTLSEKSTKRTSKKSSPSILYTVDFQAFWGAYPAEKRLEKVSAWECWLARLKDGTNPSDIIQAAKNYALRCLSEKTAPRYIKLPSTFLSYKKPYEDYIKYCPRQSLDTRTPDEIIAECYGKR